jgi:hypothetical protein
MRTRGVAVRPDDGLDADDRAPEDRRSARMDDHLHVVADDGVGARESQARRRRAADLVVDGDVVPDAGGNLAARHDRAQPERARSLRGRRAHDEQAGQQARGRPDEPPAIHTSLA